MSDILFGIQCLLHRNLPEENIILFIDQPSQSNFISTYSFPPGIEIYSTGSLTTVLLCKDMKKLVAVVTGHGGLRGIAAAADIQPYTLLKNIKELSNLETALVVLGQCFAGTFNFLEARSLDEDGQVIPPEICLLGATDLASSLSTPVDISSLPIVGQFHCPLQWSANLFLIHFMLQVADPIDYDGDGRFTVLDAYKAAGIGTSEKLLQIRQEVLKEFYSSLLTSTISQLTQSPIAQQLADKAKQDLMMVSEVVLTNQSPWILHANLARKLEL